MSVILYCLLEIFEMWCRKRYYWLKFFYFFYAVLVLFILFILLCEFYILLYKSVPAEYVF